MGCPDVVNDDWSPGCHGEFLDELVRLVQQLHRARSLVGQLSVGQLHVAVNDQGMGWRHYVCNAGGFHVMLRSRSLLNLGHGPYGSHMGPSAVGCNLTEICFGVFLAVPTWSVTS